MQVGGQIDQVRLARIVGWSLLGSIVVGISAATFVVQGIDINLTADVEATARNMLDAEQRLRAKAYIGLLTFALSVIVSLGLFMLLQAYGRLLAGWSLLIGMAAAVLVLTGTVYSMNAAEIAGTRFYADLTSQDQRLMLSALQATSDYTSFHLALVLSSIANAGFFYLLLKSRLIPVIISGWGLFASLFVASMIVFRDFIPALTNDFVTIAFILSNLIALLATGGYLSIKGVKREQPSAS